MPSTKNGAVSRRAFVAGVFAATAVSAAPAQANIFGFLKGAGDVRRIRMVSQRTGEMLDTIYWVDGQYVPEALSEVNWFMRDWRRDEAITIKPDEIDIISAVQRLLETREPFNLLSGYRSPETNAMLRRNNSGVAKSSYHMKGMAADLQLKSRSISQMARAAIACKSGGVGTYGRSNFVHMDCGPVRTWKG